MYTLYNYVKFLEFTNIFQIEINLSICQFFFTFYVFEFFKEKWNLKHFFYSVPYQCRENLFPI